MLPETNTLSRWSDVLQYPGIHQVIVQHGISLLQAIDRPQRDQTGISGPCTHEKHLTGSLRFLSHPGYAVKKYNKQSTFYWTAILPLLQDANPGRYR